MLPQTTGREVIAQVWRAALLRWGYELLALEKEAKVDIERIKTDLRTADREAEVACVLSKWHAAYRRDVNVLLAEVERLQRQVERTGEKSEPDVGWVPICFGRADRVPFEVSICRSNYHSGLNGVGRFGDAKRLIAHSSGIAVSPYVWHSLVSLAEIEAHRLNREEGRG